VPTNPRYERQAGDSENEHHEANQLRLYAARHAQQPEAKWGGER